MLNNILCIILVVVPFGLVLLAARKQNNEETTANRLVELSPIPHNGEVEYVYTRSYMEAMAPVVEFDINGYFNKENN